jgi:hypothetical protein
LRHEFIKKERPIYGSRYWTDCSQLYYCQPLIILIAKEFNIPNADAGTITYLTQAGYAIVFF